jgi:hypothetical protein
MTQNTSPAVMQQRSEPHWIAPCRKKLERKEDYL